MILESIRFKERRLEILDQLKLPSEIVYVPIVSVKDGWQAIYEMKVSFRFFLWFSIRIIFICIN
jgi:methylthioribose-1-phosphate isomerase